MIIALLFVAFVAVGVPTGFGKSAGQQESISVNDPRPLKEAVKIFEGRYGWIVTYEDPRHGPADVVDVTNAVRNPYATTPSTHRVFGPRGGPLSVTFERPRPESSPAQVADLVETIVAAYNGTGYPGRFRVIAGTDVVHVVPSSYSLLDTRVSLPAKPGRNLLEALGALLERITIETGQQVVLGSCPVNLLIQTRMEEVAAEDAAREVLLRALGATGQGLSWRLLYSLDLQKYVLNVHIVNRAGSGK